MGPSPPAVAGRGAAECRGPPGAPPVVLAPGRLRVGGDREDLRCVRAQALVSVQVKVVMVFPAPRPPVILTQGLGARLVRGFFSQPSSPRKTGQEFLTLVKRTWGPHAGADGQLPVAPSADPGRGTSHGPAAALPFDRQRCGASPRKPSRPRAAPPTITAQRRSPTSGTARRGRRWEGGRKSEWGAPQQRRGPDACRLKLNTMACRFKRHAP